MQMGVAVMDTQMGVAKIMSEGVANKMLEGVVVGVANKIRGGMGSTMELYQTKMEGVDNIKEGVATIREGVATMLTTGITPIGHN